LPALSSPSGDRCVYSNKPLIDNLKRIFGERGLLCGQPIDEGPRDDVKVTVTATTTSDESVTLSSYDAEGTPTEEAESVTVWEA
jgi:hypothetical protein